LSAAVLEELVASLGLEYAPFELKARPVIDRLLYMRNGIAHGRGHDVSLTEYSELHRETLILIDAFRDQISLAASSRRYAA
jgi:hypothetical protein